MACTVKLCRRLYVYSELDIWYTQRNKQILDVLNYDIRCFAAGVGELFGTLFRF